MSTVQNGQPSSLAELYNNFRTRLFNANLYYLANGDPHEIGSILQDIERMLDLWNDEIGYQPYQRNVLDEVETAGGDLCDETRRNIENLHYAIGHVEAKIHSYGKMSDGSPVRSDAAEWCQREAQRFNGSQVFHFRRSNAGRAGRQTNIPTRPSRTSTASCTPPPSSPAPAFSRASFAQTTEPHPSVKSETDADATIVSIPVSNRSHIRRDSPVAAEAPERKTDEGQINRTYRPHSYSASSDLSEQSNQFSPRQAYEAFTLSPTSTQVHNTPSTLSTTLSPVTPMSSAFSPLQGFQGNQEESKFPSESWGNIPWNQSMTTPSSPPQLTTLEPPVTSPHPPRLGLTGPEQYRRQAILSDNKQWPQRPSSLPPSSPSSGQ